MHLKDLEDEQEKNRRQEMLLNPCYLFLVTKATDTSKKAIDDLKSSQDHLDHADD